MTLLTTITPFWGRAEALAVWSAAIKGASIPEVRHLVFFVGEQPPLGWEEEMNPFDVSVIRCQGPSGRSIGYYHNIGVELANTEWIMKMDVDCLPNVRYFKELYLRLAIAKPREWFNGGMFYAGQSVSNALLTKSGMPLTESVYKDIVQSQSCLNMMGALGGSNFICRREDYLAMGGCDSRFHGWGWEDYQQLYALEKQRLGMDPLPGPLTLANVTQRCRDEIARPKARDLLDLNEWLALIHRWHPKSANRDPAVANRNKEILLDSITKLRTP
jgi:hypothetical protein